ncbi:hypothetical protein [Spirulina sp. 06S082]|uniref:hypothetical protein n=1 Tax=Spirulina sp. 06S082 TaxID=3110248 RepID=UPI002B1FBC4A|nr:hypothetical protein [Spirulina sp. 06S082]MEA5469466.1 hypothetical protein [Spirulina sp. 06S082]
MYGCPIHIDIKDGKIWIQHLAEIVERSQTLRDRLAESSARGLLGEMYERHRTIARSA